MIKTIWQWIDDRSGFSDVVMPLLTHIVPSNARWWYIFGSATLCAFIVQVVTGVSLAMMYVPGGEDAYQSLKYISEQAPFGSLVRGMHYYGASAMVALAMIHMVQVFLHAAYKYPREMNWMSGVVLLFVVLGMAFTGQLLRWDANGVWTVVVASEMAGRAPVVGTALAHFVLGGDTVGGATLSRFFVFHVFVLPGIIIAGLVLHLGLIFRHGISEMPKVGQKVDPKTYKKDYEARLKRSGEPFWPNAMWRDVVFSLALVVVILVLAIVFGAPALSTPPDPSSIHANPSPDWYFWWYFTILSLSPPALETWIILGGPVIAFLLMFFVPLLSNKGERAPSRRPWAVGLVIAGVVGFVVLSIYGYREPWSPDFGVPELPARVVGTTEGPVANGAKLVHAKGCLYCHDIDGFGGHRGPELTYIGDQLTRDDLIIRINNGGHNMPAFATAISAKELSDILAFLQTRREVPDAGSE